MKILFLIQYFSPQKGGSVYYVYNLAKRLTMKGHDIVILTVKEDMDVDFCESLSGVKIHSFSRRGGPLLVALAMRKVLINEIGRCDLFHLNNFWNYQNIVLVGYARKFNVPYIISPHGSLPIIMKSYLRKFLYRLLFGNKILKEAARVIAVSKLEYDQILAKGVLRPKIAIIPPVFEIPQNILEYKGAFRQKYGLDDKMNILLFLGRLHPIKGIPILIKAYAELHKTFTATRLVLAGPDDSYGEEEIKKQIQVLGIDQQVIQTGLLEGADKYAAYVDADVYILPSVYEVFGSTILEACGCGIPVVVTKQCGMAGYVSDNKVGEVISYDWKELLAALTKLLSDKELMSKYGRAGKRMVREYFSAERTTNDYERLCREVLNDKSIFR